MGYYSIFVHLMPRREELDACLANTGRSFSQFYSLPKASDKSNFLYPPQN